MSTADHGNVVLCVITTSMANGEETLNRSAYAKAVLTIPSSKVHNKIIMGM